MLVCQREPILVIGHMLYQLLQQQGTAPAVCAWHTWPVPLSSKSSRTLLIEEKRRCSVASFNGLNTHCKIHAVYSIDHRKVRSTKIAKLYKHRIQKVDASLRHLYKSYYVAVFWGGRLSSHSCAESKSVRRAAAEDYGDGWDLMAHILARVYQPPFAWECWIDLTVDVSLWTGGLFFWPLVLYTCTIMHHN